MKKTLEGGENVKISGFGNFEVKQKRDRRGRNPATGDAMTITARRILRFHPSSRLKARINGDVDPYKKRTKVMTDANPSTPPKHRDWRKRASLDQLV